MKNRLYTLLGILLFLSISFTTTAQQSVVDSLQEVVSNSKFDTQRIIALNLLAGHLQWDDSEQSRKYVKQAIEESEKIGFNRGLAQAYQIEGILNYLDNRNDEALVSYGKCVEYAEPLQLMELLGKCYNNTGLIYDERADYDKALEYYVKSLEIKEEMNNERGMLNSYNNIALIYNVRRDYEQALQFHTKSLNLAKKLKDQKAMARSYNNLGIVRTELGQYNDALDLYMQSLNLEKKLGNKNGMSFSYNNIGEVLEKLDYTETALDYYMKGLNLKLEIGELRTLSSSYNNIGGIYLKMDRHNEALFYFRKGEQWADSLDSRDNLKLAYQGLSITYAALADYEKAYGYQLQFAALKDSLLNEENSRNMAEMAAKYEVSKKDRELQQSKLKSLASQKAAADEIQRKENMQLLLIALSIVIMLVAFIFYTRSKVKQKAADKLEKAYSDLEVTNKYVNSKNKEITASIRYAKRIQQSILPPTDYIQNTLKDYFILYQPKDIVSGDFYWIATPESDPDMLYVAAVDCTGHGVPGAFVSIVGYNLLNECLKDQNLRRPATILDALNKLVQETLHQHTDDTAMRDGMDISLIAYNRKTMQVEFAGAKNPLYVLRKYAPQAVPDVKRLTTLETNDGVYGLHEIKGDKQPIGTYLGEIKPFTNHEMQLEAGDCLYLFSDGYPDQFGGDQGKKFMIGQFKKVLLSLYDIPMPERAAALEKTLMDWRGELEQIDDICVIGIRL